MPAAEEPKTGCSHFFLIVKVSIPSLLHPQRRFVEQDRPYNFKSDIWSLGVVLYEVRLEDLLKLGTVGSHLGQGVFALGAWRLELMFLAGSSQRCDRCMSCRRPSAGVLSSRSILDPARSPRQHHDETQSNCETKCPIAQSLKPPSIAGTLGTLKFLQPTSALQRQTPRPRGNSPSPEPQLRTAMPY